MNSAGVRDFAKLIEKIQPDIVEINTPVRPPAESSAKPERRQRLLEIADMCPVHRTLHSEVVIETIE